MWQDLQQSVKTIQIIIKQIMLNILIGFLKLYMDQSIKESFEGIERF